ncbi:MAG: tRNA dimethylallyltransferase, partial [Pseudomonadota bacterium]
NQLRTDLIEKDPITAARIDLSNPARVQRAWEVWATTGQSLAKLQDETPPPMLPLDEVEPVALMPDPTWLNARIARRFEAMVEGGAVDEVLAWTTAGWPDTLPAAKAIGRREISAWQTGELSRDEAITQATIATRQYAKRQRTWIRNRFARWQNLDPARPIEDLLDAIAPA